MDILKDLLSKTFTKRLDRLEERASQQMIDLQYTGESFIKQGKSLDKLSIIKIEEPQSKTKPNEEIKREGSANVARNQKANRTTNKEKEASQEKIRTNTPTFNNNKNRSRSKTPINTGRSTVKSGTKASSELMTPNHSKKKSFNSKGFSALRDKTPEKVDKKTIMVNKKKENNDKSKVLTNTPNEQKKVVKKFNINNTTTKAPEPIIKPKEQIKLTEKTVKANYVPELPPKLSDIINTPIQQTQPIHSETEKKAVQALNFDDNNITPIEMKKQEEPIKESENIPKLVISYEKFDINKFIIENYNKPVFESITVFLNSNDKINLFTSTKCFKYYLGLVIQQKKKEFDEKYNITSSSTIDDKINELRFKYKAEQLKGDITPFQISRGAIKAIELLNEELYNRIFHQTELKPPLNEIVLVYRIFFQLLNNNELSSIKNDNLFWRNASEYILKNNNGLTGTFFSQKAADFVFTSENVNKVATLIQGKLDHIKPTFYSKICGTTGLVIFLIKDALEYCGILFYEKKTSLVLLYNRLCYLKSVQERVLNYFDYLKQ